MVCCRKRGMEEWRKGIKQGMEAAGRTGNTRVTRGGVTHLCVLGEEVVGVDVHGREVPDGLELKGQLHRLTLAAVVLPTNPLVA